MTQGSGRLHICYVETGYPHPHGGGGAGTYIQLTGRELVRLGHQVSVVSADCPRCPEVTSDQGVTVIRPKRRGHIHWYAGRLPGLNHYALAMRKLEHGWWTFLTLERLHRRCPIDVVEFTEGGDFWHSLRAPFACISHLHGSRYTSLRMAGKPVGPSDWRHRRLELFSIDKADWVLSPSAAMLDQVQYEAGKSFRNTTIIPLPLDPDIQGNEIGGSFLSLETSAVLFAARNDPIKGADTLLAAIPLVRRELPGVSFKLVGYEHAMDQPLPDGAKCIPFLPKEQLYNQYRLADVVVVPSRWDNSPNVVYEAMASGKAVVASRVGGIPELVIEGKTGLLVEPDNPDELAGALIQLLRHGQLRREMGNAGKDHIWQIAGLESNVQKRLAIYFELCRLAI